MAYLKLHFHSDSLRRAVAVDVILPESSDTLIGMKTGAEKSYKTLWLLHGLSDDESIWMRRSSIERYASESGIAVVMPDGGRSWYTDMANGDKYLTFITKELPAACRGFFRGMSERREDNFIGGLSMGGYGAVKAALLCPESYGGCICLSGALDIVSFAGEDMLNEWRAIFGYDLKSPEQLRDSEHDVYRLARENKAAGKPFPKIYMWCGTDDYLLDNSVRFDKLLSELGVAHIYKESDGNHGWKWWDLHIQDGISYLSKS